MRRLLSALAIAAVTVCGAGEVRALGRNVGPGHWLNHHLVGEARNESHCPEALPFVKNIEIFAMGTEQKNGLARYEAIPLLLCELVAKQSSGFGYLASPYRDFCMIGYVRSVFHAWRWVRYNGAFSVELEGPSRGLPAVYDRNDKAWLILNIKAFSPDIADVAVSPQLSLRSIAGNRIGTESQSKSDQNKNRAYSGSEPGNRCPPGRISGCIRRFPLGAQIGISLVVALAALLSLARAFRPFGLLVVTRRDRLQGAGSALAGIGLLWLSFRVWMLGG